MAAPNLTLYYFPLSFFSKKAYWYILERKIPFTPRIVDLSCQEQYEPWYVTTINPKCEVPAIKHGDKIVADSAEIMKYLEQNVKTDVSLAFVPPDAETLEKCNQLSDQLNKVPVYQLTFGSIFATDYLKDSKMPPHFNKGYIQKRKDGLHEAIKKHPEHKANYETKLQSADLTPEQIRENFISAVTATDDIMDKVEGALKDNASKGTGPWLCGSQFTVADIHMGTVVDRLTMIGLACRYWKENPNRPCLNEYATKIQTREGFQATMKPPMPADK